MLKTIATPYHIRTLFELMLSSGKTNQIYILTIINNLIKNKVPLQVFYQALGEPFDLLNRHSVDDSQIDENQLLFIDGLTNPLSKFFYAYAIQVRRGNMEVKNDELYCLSRRLLKMALQVQEFDDFAIKQAFSNAMLKI